MTSVGLLALVVALRALQRAKDRLHPSSQPTCKQALELRSIVSDQRKGQAIRLSFGGRSVIGATLDHPAVTLYRMTAKTFPKEPVGSLSASAGGPRQGRIA
jgi:hypothetical protein